VGREKRNNFFLPSLHFVGHNYSSLYGIGDRGEVTYPFSIGVTIVLTLPALGSFYGAGIKMLAFLGEKTHLIHQRTQWEVSPEQCPRMEDPLSGSLIPTPPQHPPL
jgi:hypothetical protein